MKFKSSSAPVMTDVLSEAESYALRLARLCTEALIAEAELTPKPGLVDRRGPGSHHDLSLSLMRRSALAIERYFYAMALISSGACACQELRERLAAIGRDAERAMYKATGGSNSHKGAIWVLGLLVSAVSIAGENACATVIAETARDIAAFDDRATPELVTHGHRVAQVYGVRGARGEAAAGFPHVLHVGLPTLRAKRRWGAAETVARLDTLLGIMSCLDDTCVLYRGGAAALDVVKEGARRVIVAGGCSSRYGEEQLKQLDDQLLQLAISPGGSADLLAATLFLDAVERKQTKVREDQSWSEETYGTHGV